MNMSDGFFLSGGPRRKQHFRQQHGTSRNCYTEKSELLLHEFGGTTRRTTGAPMGHQLRDYQKFGRVHQTEVAARPLPAAVPQQGNKFLRVRKLRIDDMRATVNIRTPDAHDVGDSADYRKLAFLSYLPIDMPNLTLRVGTQELRNKVGSSGEIVSQLKRAYLKSIVWETGIAFASSYLLGSTTACTGSFGDLMTI
ncbi:unnamed protein product [Amoebophrya sp. A25]|nr:unnamed protein product [Amoebophrya sp. A25]|eukprot:GSA25T00010388001.1